MSLYVAGDNDNTMNNTGFDKKRRRKIGRTLVVKSNTLPNNLTLTGLVSSVDSTSGSKFLVFDTVDNAKTGFRELRTHDLNTKPSYYRLFFRLKEYEGKTYDEIKQEMVNHMTSNYEGTNVLYYKLKSRDGNLTGTGEFVLDRKEDMDKLLETHNLSVGGMSVSVFRYIMPNKRQQRE